MASEVTALTIEQRVADLERVADIQQRINQTLIDLSAANGKAQIVGVIAIAAIAAAQLALTVILMTRGVL
jgi:phosphotransacetylase